MENVVAKYRRVMLGSLPPTLCVDALGGDFEFFQHGGGVR